jgi:hypothetical protein
LSEENLPEVPERPLTKPDIPKKPDKGLTRQIPVRLHHHDHAMLKALLKKDSMSLQKFIGFCVRGYLDADPLMLKMIKNYRELEAVPRDIREKHILSHRERQNILDEIEKGTP